MVVQKPVRVYAFLTIDNGTAIIKGNAVKARFGNDIGVGGVFESCFTCWVNTIRHTQIVAEGQTVVFAQAVVVVVKSVYNFAWRGGLSRNREVVGIRASLSAIAAYQNPRRNPRHNRTPIISLLNLIAGNLPCDGHLQARSRGRGAIAGYVNVEGGVAVEVFSTERLYGVCVERVAPVGVFLAKRIGLGGTCQPLSREVGCQLRAVVECNDKLYAI